MGAAAGLAGYSAQSAITGTSTQTKPPCSPVMAGVLEELISSRSGER